MLKNFLDDFYDILFNYRKGLARVAEEKNIWHGLLVYIIVTLVVFLATLDITPASINGSELFPPEIYFLLPPQLLDVIWRLLPLVTILLQLVFGPLYFLLLVAVLSFVSDLFGGNARASNLGAVIGYAHLPFLIVAVGGLLGRYTPFNITAFLILAAFFWSLWLHIAGLQQVNAFSWGRSVLVYFMPLIALLVSFILFMLLVIVFITPLLMQVWEGFI
ncbi:MAG: Yip1 family protein [Bacillota bacterium]